jgi:hypothetical protein
LETIEQWATLLFKWFWEILVENWEKFWKFARRMYNEDSRAKEIIFGRFIKKEGSFRLIFLNILINIKMWLKIRNN